MKSIAFCTSKHCELIETCKRQTESCLESIDAKYACSNGSLYVQGDLKLPKGDNTSEDKSDEKESLNGSEEESSEEANKQVG